MNAATEDSGMTQWDLNRGLPEGRVNCVYMLQCKDGSLYTGWTNDIKKRLLAHQSGKGAKYTRGRGPLTLVHLEIFQTKSEAMHREAMIKQLSRQEKLKLLQN